MLRLALVLLASSSVLLAQTRPVAPVVAPPKFNIDDWTPRAATGQAEPWEKKRDPDWDDARFLKTDTGPTFHGTMKYNRGRESVMVYKALTVRFGEKAEAGILFDRVTCRLAAAWTGGYLQHSPKRFALLNTPTPPSTAKMVLATTPALGWSDDNSKFDLPVKPTTALEPQQIQYLGHTRHDDRVVLRYRVQGVNVLDSVKYIPATGGFLRTLQVDASDKPLSLRVDDTRISPLPASKDSRVIYLSYGTTGEAKPDDFTELSKPTTTTDKPIVTKLITGDESGPFAVDTLTLPTENPAKAVLFCTGLDFLPDGRIALCTVHGDVWLATVNDKEGIVSWQRFASGLYHPIGLKVVDGKVFVLEVGQLTRLLDTNNDGQADEYECYCNRWHTGPGEHAYDTGLETDPKGNFYFFKTGDTDLPSGGCLLKVSADGKTVETFATGFRHPIGIGMSSTGIVTGADQEGNWMPATRIDQYKPGGFYGDLRAHHRTTPPKTYDPPLCWLPREVDNSAGGQVWVPEKTFGPLASLPLHFSYGRCRAYLLLRQEFSDGMVQGGASSLPMQFLSGSMRGRFNGNGELYVCGLNGWQTSAKADGSLQRVRATGKPLDTVVAMEANTTGMKVTFSRDMDEKTLLATQNYKAAWWNYRWNGDYGSKRWKVTNPNAEGQDELVIESVRKINARTLQVNISGGMRPVMQFQLGYNLKAGDGATVSGSTFFTVHQLAKE